MNIQCCAKTNWVQYVHRAHPNPKGLTGTVRGGQLTTSSSATKQTRGWRHRTAAATVIG
jgi:hypothetical protein